MTASRGVVRRSGSEGSLFIIAIVIYYCTVNYTMLCRAVGAVQGSVRMLTLSRETAAWAAFAVVCLQRVGVPSTLG